MADNDQMRDLTEAVATALMTAERDEAGLLDEIAKDAQAVAERLMEAGWRKTPATSEQPLCTHVAPDGRRCLEVRTDQHVHVYDQESWNALHNPAASEQPDHWQQCGDPDCPCHDSDDPTGDRWADEVAADRPSDKRELTRWMEQNVRLANERDKARRAQVEAEEREMRAERRVDDLQARIEEALALHCHTDDPAHGHNICGECAEEWPCPTFAALSGTESGGEQA